MCTIIFDLDMLLSRCGYYPQRLILTFTDKEIFVTKEIFKTRDHFPNMLAFSDFTADNLCTYHRELEDSMRMLAKLFVNHSLYLIIDTNTILSTYSISEEEYRERISERIYNLEITFSLNKKTQKMLMISFLDPLSYIGCVVPYMQFFDVYLTISRMPSSIEKDTSVQKGIEAWTQFLQTIVAHTFSIN
jgi:hypothetical protein